MARDGKAPTRSDGGINMITDEDLIELSLNQSALKQNLILRFSC